MLWMCYVAAHRTSRRIDWVQRNKKRWWVKLMICYRRGWFRAVYLHIVLVSCWSRRRMLLSRRALITCTQQDKELFPDSRIDDILDRLKGGAFFKHINLKHGYHHVWIRPEDVHMTVFRISFGLDKLLVMPFCLTNATATFNDMMDMIFRASSLCWYVLWWYDCVLQEWGGASK